LNNVYILNRKKSKKFFLIYEEHLGKLERRGEGELS